MQEATIVAVVILGGVFLLMSITIIKSGIDAAIKLWSVMGALTGVAFGGITSFYFTDKSNQHEIQQALLEKNASVDALNHAVNKAVAVNNIISPINAALKGEISSFKTLPFSIKIIKTINSIPEEERLVLVNQFEQASTQLKSIIWLPTEAMNTRSYKLRLMGLSRTVSDQKQ